jgi:hypothetical protein
MMCRSFSKLKGDHVMGYGVVCQSCGVEAPAKKLQYYQNIGALFMRFHRKIDGYLCKRCVHSNYWKMTGVTAAIGWLGTISFFVAPVFVIINTVNYLGALGMPKVPDDATAPDMADQNVPQRVFPRAPEIFDRLNQREELGDIARDVAPQIGVTPGQLALYIGFLARQHAAVAQAQRPTGGFPVMPAPTAAPAAPTPPPLINAAQQA